jgi:hypothetical protein
MDWFGFDMPVYYPIDVGVGESADVSRLQALLPVALVIAIVIVIAVAVQAHARRRRTFWCAIADREVVTEFRRGRVCACSAFESATAITCDRRCTDAAFRQQWPPVLPVVMRPVRRGGVA